MNIAKKIMIMMRLWIISGVIVFNSMSVLSSSANAAEMNDNLSESGKEIIFSKKVSIDGEKKRIKISEYKNKYEIFIGRKKVKMKRISIDAGYLHTRIMIKDIDQDNKSEVILKLYGGASAARTELQVFSQDKNHNWQEIGIEEEVWNDEFISLKAKKDNLYIDVKKTGYHKKIDIKSEDKDALNHKEFGIAYIKSKVRTDRIVIKYGIFLGTTGNIVAVLKQDVVYDAESDCFVCRNTSFMDK